jgi:MIP family channel proteins
MPNLGQQALAEAVGTFALIFVGAGSIMAFLATGADPGRDAAAFVGVALAHGLTIAVMVTATGHISGGHLNPAVTLGLFAAGRVRVVQAVTYIISQIVGASVAAALLLLAFPQPAPAAASLTARQALGSATPDLGPGISVGQGILIEAILTFFLLFAVAGTAVDDRTPARIGGLAIGLTVLLDILMGGRLTGASMNPARTFGPALLSGHWTNHVVYWIGPVLGGIIASMVYSYMLMAPRPTTKELGHEHEAIEKEH